MPPFQQQLITPAKGIMREMFLMFAKQKMKIARERRVNHDIGYPEQCWQPRR